MNAFRYAQAHDASSAMATLHAQAGATYVAGGTNVLDLMKDDVERPALLVDITALPMRAIEPSAHGVRVGSLAADERRRRPSGRRARFPGRLAGAAAERLAAAAQHGDDRRQRHAAHALRVLPRRLAAVQQARAGDRLLRDRRA